MILDIEKLKALALAARDQGAWPFHEIAFRKAVDPATVLAMIAEVERLSAAQTNSASKSSSNCAAALAGAGRDAERYRWLRDKSEPGICSFYLSVGKAFHGVKFARETVDEAIDAAIEAHTKAGKN